MHRSAGRRRQRRYALTSGIDGTHEDVRPAVPGADKPNALSAQPAVADRGTPSRRNLRALLRATHGAGRRRYGGRCVQLLPVGAGSRLPRRQEVQGRIRVRRVVWRCKPAWARRAWFVDVGAPPRAICNSAAAVRYIRHRRGLVLSALRAARVRAAGRRLARHDVETRLVSQSYR